MRTERINLWKPEEYSYPLSFGFIPNMVSYVHEDSEEDRPCVLVVPGGGYCFVSPSEGGIVAEKFYAKGYNTFVLTYTINMLMSEPLKMQPLQDISRAIRILRKNAKEYRICPEQLAVCGFSAGGHLSGSVAVHYEDVEDIDKEYQGISNRPNAAILSYPVITSGEFAHRGSFISLFGEDASEEELSYMSLEKHVTEQTPPCFLWQTATDETVPVENSYLFAAACRTHKVPFAHHVFPAGKHGLSLSDARWASGDLGEPYTTEQNVKIVEKIKTGELSVPTDAREGLAFMLACMEDTPREAMKNQAEKDVAIWPELADAWLKRMFE